MTVIFLLLLDAELWNELENRECIITKLKDSFVTSY